MQKFQKRKTIFKIFLTKKSSMVFYNKNFKKFKKKYFFKKNKSPISKKIKFSKKNFSATKSRKKMKLF